MRVSATAALGSTGWRGEPHWRAELQLGFEPRPERTVLAKRSHRGPLLVQRPFYPEGAVAHVYLLHPPGGVVGGDELLIRADCSSGAHALLTTPAAGKFYRSSGNLARQTISLNVAAEAALEWLPQETILFDGAEVDCTLKVDLAEDSRFIGWDVLCLGRPAAAETFERGNGCFRLNVYRQDEPLLQETFHADARFARSNWGLSGRPVMATLLAHPFRREHLPAVRSVLDGWDEAGTTLLGDLLVVRAMGRQAEPIRRLFYGVWRVIRPLVMGREVCLPRVWAT